MRSYFRKDYNPAFTNFTYPIKSFVSFDGATSEDLLPLSTGVYAYNVCAKNGRLYQAEGVEEAKINGRPFPDLSALGSRIINAAVYLRYDYDAKERDDMLVALLENKKLYYMRFSDMRFVDTGTVCSTRNVTFLNYHGTDGDYFLIMTDDAMSYLFDGTTVHRFDAPASDSACVHGTRVFSVSKTTNRLSFSKELAPTYWAVSSAGGGNISFPDGGGALTGVVDWKNYVFVFREFAVYRLTAFADQSDFSLTKVYSTTSKIYFDTVAVCDDRMIFLTDDGFYTFDGFAAKRDLRGLFPFVSDKKSARAAYFGGKYYLSAEIKRDGETVGDECEGVLERNGVLSYDVLLGYTGVFRGADIKQFLPVCQGGESVLLLFFGGETRKYSVGTFNESGRLFATALKKLWRSPVTDLGHIDKIKVLKRMFIRSKCDITLDLILDKKYPVDLIGGPEAKMIPINRSAEKIGMEIKTDEDELEVSGVLYEFSFIRRPKKYE